MSLRHLVFVLLLVGFGAEVRCQNSKENADFKLALNLYNDSLFDLAAEQMKQFIASYPNTAQGIEARFYLGLTQLKLQRYDDARMTFQTFALTYQDNPKAPEAWWNVGESYAAIQNYREAALGFERVKVFHPKSKLAPDALVRAGAYFSMAGERENARRVLRIVLQEYPASSAVLSARTNLAKIYFDEGNLEQAQSELKRVIEGDPSPDAKAQALMILGNIQQSTGKGEQAKAQYQEIITRYKTTSAVQGAYVSLGKLLASSGKPAEAIDNFKKALAEKSHTDSSLIREATLEMGSAYASLKDYSNAVTSYEKYLAEGPADERTADVLWKIARTSARGKIFKKSNDACNRILKSGSPDQLKRRAQLLLAVNAQEQKNPALAIQLLGEFAGSYPDDPTTPAVVFRMASITEKELRDPRRAAPIYESLPARFQRSPLVDDALAGAARCFEQLKEFDRALILEREITEKYPASEFVPGVRDRIATIEIFEAKDKDAGLEKLAALVGDVVAQKDKPGLPFRLGEIYFQDLKNYPAAAAQMTNALEAGLTDPRAREARYLRAKSLEYMSRRDEKQRPAAIEAYQEFLQSSATDARSTDAALALFTLRATTATGAYSSAAEILARFPEFPRRDAILLRIGILQEKADSTAAALQTYTELIDAYPLSPSAEEAGYRRFGLLVRTGPLDSAITAGDAYNAAHPSGPNTATVTARLADIALERQNAARAAGLYQHLTTEFFYSSLAPQAQTHLADARASNGDYTEAIALYNELMKQQRENLLDEKEVDPDLLLALGKAQYLSGSFKEAKTSLFQLLEHERTGPRAGEAYYTLGVIARSQGALEAATGYFRLAGTVAPGAGATRDIANLLYDSGEYTDAIRQYTQLSQTAKADSDRQYYDARIILARLRSDDAGPAEKEIAAFTKKYSDARADFAAFELEKGNFAFRKNDYPRALKSYQVVTGKYDDTPSAPEGLYWTGKTLEATNKTLDAIESFTRLLQDYPDAPIAPRAHLALGNIYYRLEKWDESIKSYRRIVDNPKADPALLPFAMSNLIETYETAGANDAALALTRKYLDLYPNSEDNLDKRIKIGILYERLGYYDQAVLHLQALLDEAGSDLEGEIRYYIAEANYNKGDYQQAILDFLKVPYLVTKKGKIDWTANSLYMSGQSYEKMGRYDQALIMYQQILDRSGIDETFKIAARKEIDRVKLVLKKKTN